MAWPGWLPLPADQTPLKPDNGGHKWTALAFQKQTIRVPEKWNEQAKAQVSGLNDGFHPTPHGHTGGMG